MPPTRKNTTMKALGKLSAAPGVHIYYPPIPECGPNDVLIKVKKSAICGTDMHIYNWDSWSQQTVPVPLTMGHEFVGAVVAYGMGVNTFKVGDRVSAEGHVTCQDCRNCRTGKAHICAHTKGIGVHIDGAFAEYVKVPESNVIRIPDAINDDIAAILDPLGNALHTALSFDMVGEDVLIVGAGPIGCMAIQVAKNAGARKVAVTDINDYRLHLAVRMGADFVVDVKNEDLQQAMFTRMGLVEGFDVGLEMSGAPSALGTMIECLRPGAPIAVLGIPSKNDIPLDWGKFIFKGLTLKGIYGREMYDTWYKMIAMIKGGMDVSPIITHHFPVDAYETAFKTMQSGKSGKVILEW